MEGGLKLRADAVAAGNIFLQSPVSVHKPPAPLHARRAPGGGLLKVPYEHLIEAHSVRAHLLHQAVGVYYVVEGLAHLDDGVVSHFAVLLPKGLLDLLTAAVFLKHFLLLSRRQVLKIMGV